MSDKIRRSVPPEELGEEMKNLQEMDTGPEEMDTGPQEVPTRAMNSGSIMGLTDEFTASPAESLANNTLITGSALGEALKHIPGINIAVSAAYIAKYKKEINEVEKKALAVRDSLNQVVPKSADPEHPVTLGLRVGEFAEQHPNATMTDMLANTLGFALAQKARHLDKTKRYLFGSELNLGGSTAALIGAHVAGFGAAPGIVISGMGSLVAGKVTGTSLVNYIKRVRSGDIWVHRENHAKLLYGLAIRHLESQGKTPPGKKSGYPLHDKSMEFFEKYESRQRGEGDPQKEAYDLLVSLGILDPTNLGAFYKDGFPNTAKFLRSRN